jgi:thioredoxin 1
MNNGLILTDANFQQEVEASNRLVMVDFSASWCPPCRVLAPIVEELAKEYEGRAAIGTLDTDANPQTAARFGIRGLPTLLFFRDGILVDTIVGAQPKARLSAKLDALLSARAPLAPVGGA